MAVLKRKTASGWETVTPAGDWPTPIPVQVTEVDADLVPLTVTENGAYTPQAPHNGFSRVDVNVAGVPSVIQPGDTVVLSDPSTSYSANITSWGPTGISLTIRRSGTYRFKWSMSCERDGSTTYSRLYVNGVAKGTTKTYTQSGYDIYSLDCEQELTVVSGDTVELWHRETNIDGANWGMCGGLCACIDWDNGF